MAIRFNMNPLEATTTLPYLGCTVTYNNSDWDALYSNLCEYQRIWGMLVKILGKTKAPIKSREMMQKAVAQAVLLYGSGSWVVTDVMMTVLEGFHHRILDRLR